MSSTRSSRCLMSSSGEGMSGKITADEKNKRMRDGARGPSQMLPARACCASGHGGRLSGCLNCSAIPRAWQSAAEPRPPFGVDAGRGAGKSRRRGRHGGRGWVLGYAWHKTAEQFPEPGQQSRQVEAAARARYRAGEGTARGSNAGCDVRVRGRRPGANLVAIGLAEEQLLMAERSRFREREIIHKERVGRATRVPA